MKILLTGASGFLGRELLSVLEEDNEVITLGRSASNQIQLDLSQDIKSIEAVPEMVVHAAGMAHIYPKSDTEREFFFQVNHQGTINLTKALAISGLPKSLVFISTVAVYGNESGINIAEDAPLAGDTPYGLSKIRAEQYLIDWGKENNVKVCILRLPLIAGPNPPGNLGAIKKAIKKGYYFRLGEGKARKSMVWASDIAEILPRCFENEGIFNLTDGVDPSIGELDVAIGAIYSRKIRAIPQSLINLMALPSKLLSFWPLNENRIGKLTKSLTFSSEKAVRELGWKPNSIIDCIDKYGI